VTWEKATRQISLSLSATEWTELLREVDQLGPEHRFRCALSGQADSGLTSVRLGELIGRGFSWEECGSSGRSALVPRPAGVLYVVSPLDAQDEVPSWMSHLSPHHFRQYLLAVDTADEAFVDLASLCAGESWHLDAFVRRDAWAEFIMEFIASREIDLVQIVTSRLGVDLIPALRAAYPFIRVVVDTGRESAHGQVWLTYVTSRYGNVIDAFCTPQPAVAAALHAEGVSPSRIHLWRAEEGKRDESAAALHRETYGRLLAGLVG
jgi:hypothetical protein